MGQVLLTSRIRIIAKALYGVVWGRAGFEHGGTDLLDPGLWQRSSLM